MVKTFRSKCFIWISILMVLLSSACSTMTNTAGTPVSSSALPTNPPSASRTPAEEISPVSPTTLAGQSTETISSTVVAATPAPVSTPVCNSTATLTPAATEGPYFKTNSPERSSLIDTSMVGTRLLLTGYVLTADCQPVPNALLDFWQADSQGQYDNAGYTLRGHQSTDENGYYQLETIIPGEYPGRTEHIHVKVQAQNGPVLTTQLFFPGVQANDSDGIYNPALLINIEDTGSDAIQGTFNFIINP